jgi:NAD(P)-dependent dehydrogenase (short-subunit alcohol dehydrogenase family)
MKSKIVLVTGAAGALGQAIAALFAEHGAVVIGADLKPPERQTAGVHFAALDVTDEASWASVLGDIDRTHGGLDILVNGAGIFRPNIAFEDMPLATWKAHFAVNTDGVFLGCQHAIRHMKTAGRRGAIVNIASGLGIRARDSAAAYCASKAAALMITRTAALAGGPHGIRVNAILPGPIPSPMLMSGMPAGETEESFLAGMMPRMPLGRLATREDVADAVLFLASDSASAISGVLLPVDGGDMPGA